MSPDTLSTSDPRWLLTETVEAIAAGSDWDGKVTAFWALVDQNGHDLAHPKPIAGCPGCPQDGMCEWCTRVAADCPDPADHYRRARGSEESLLIGSALCGRDGGR